MRDAGTAGTTGGVPVPARPELLARFALVVLTLGCPKMGHDPLEMRASNSGEDLSN